MKKYTQILRLVATYGQLGFSLITPPVVMALVGWWLQSRFGLGTWVMLVCLLVGLASSAASAWQFYLRVTARDAKARKEPEQQPVAFYTHE